MEYLVYYSNGEEGYLSHSGVKGMKWGVWNEETKARHAGRSSSKLREKSERTFWKSQAAYAEGNKAKGDSLHKKHVRLVQKAYDKENRKAINDKANEYWKIRKTQGKNSVGIKMVKDRNESLERGKNDDSKVFYDAVFRRYAKKESNSLTMKSAAIGAAVGVGSVIVKNLL